MLNSEPRANGLYGIFTNAGAPSNGTSEVNTLTESGTPTGGTFKLRVGTLGTRTAAIAYDASAATIVTALEALETIGSGGVTATGGPLNTTPVVITFAGAQARKAQSTLVLASNDLTGGTSPSVGIAKTTTGVDATDRGAAAGALLINTTDRILYMNMGTAQVPNWVPRIGRGSVEDHTADDTLTVYESGTVHTNTGASGTIVFTLPPSVVGLEYTFVVGAAQALRIDPDGTETISLPSTGVPGAAGKYLGCSTVGATVRLVCGVTGNWNVVGSTGTWTAEA